MARAALSGRLNWQLARVLELIPETPHTTSLVLSAPDWAGHRAGQHVDVRLTAADGYQAQRSYSLACAPEDQNLELTVETIAYGEVSPYLTQQLRAGDDLELRGPIGGYFVWESSDPRPLQLIGGGSGIVPLRAMLRHRVATAATVPARVLYSARSVGDLIYAAEIPAWRQTGAEVAVTLTRHVPAGWAGHRGRVTREMLEAAAFAPESEPHTFLCGPNRFVESVSELLLAAGHPASSIRTERFGPTG